MQLRKLQLMFLVGCGFKIEKMTNVSFFFSFYEKANSHFMFNLASSDGLHLLEETFINFH